MPLPGDLTTTVLTGTFLDPAGNPMRGTVTIVPNASLTDATGNVIIPQLQRSYQLFNGAFTSAPLVSTDNTDINPSGFAYLITIALQEVPAYSFTVLLPHSVSPLDLSALSPAVSVPQVASALPVTGGVLTGKLTLDGSIPLQIPAGAAAGDVLTSDASGNASWSSVSADGIATTAALTAETSRAEAVEALKAPLASPALTGSPTAPTKTALTSNTDIATTAYADSAVAAETSRAGTAEALKAPLASPALTGSPTAPTQTTGDATTKIATDAFVSTAVATETTRAEAAEATLTASIPALPVTIAHGGTGSTTQNFTGLLTQTAVKTSAYSAAAGDFVCVDTTSGAVTVTLPNAPADLTVVAVKMIASAATPNAVTIACAGSDVINKTGGSTSATLTLLEQSSVFQYQHSTGIWLKQTGDVPLGQLDARYPQRAAGTSSPAAPLQYYNPKDDGAVFDGTTDDSAHLLTTLARGNTIQFPPGTTVVNAAQLTFQSSNLHVRGSGMYDTTVKCTNASLSSLWLYGSSFVNTVELSDMTLDGTGVSISAAATLGNRLDRLRIRRVRFVNWPSVIIQSGYAAEVIVEDCEADGAGLGTGTFFLSTNRENESVILRRNRLRWLNTGITIGSGNPTAAQYHSAYIDISDNYIDLGWWLLKAVSSNSGGTVTYTSTTVTDTAASFGTIAAGTTIRVLTPLQTGTLTTIGTQVTDASGNFTTSNVWRGHIIRSGSAFAVVSKVETATQLHVEEWLSQTTYQPVTPPSSASYTIYGVTLGATVSNTSTAITVAHGGGGNGGTWYDLQGNSVTPASGTLYEVLPAHPVYPIFCNIPTEKIKIHGNTIRRGWADGIEFFGSRGIITGNIVEDGQDEGIVVEGLSLANPGVKNVVANNICRHNGTSGLNLQFQSDLEVGPNQLEDNTWGDPSSLNLPQLLAYQLVNSTITSGRATNSGESAINQVGMTIDGSSTSGLKVIGWSGHGAAVADIRITSAVTAGTCDLLDVDGVIAYQGTTNGQRLRVKGTGTPSLIASPGSQFLSTSGSGPGTALYVKESANDSTGWDVMGATVTPSVQWVTATGSYTWTKPAGAQVVDVILCAAGGGGASGAIETTGNAGGGGGGGGGGVTIRSFAAADLSSSVTGSVGTGGAGGAAVSGTSASNGNNGAAAGGSTTFGTFAFASGGNTGAQGTTSGGNGAAVQVAGTSPGGTGGAGGASAAGGNSAVYGAATGGGGGGGANTSTAFNGGTGEFCGMGGTANTGTAGVAGGASPGTGTTPAVKGTPSCGGGGGAGANGASPTAQGGATPFYGGGGGGGGGAFIASGTGTSGAGGTGGPGFALIITHFA